MFDRVLNIPLTTFPCFGKFFLLNFDSYIQASRDVLKRSYSEKFQKTHAKTFLMASYFDKVIVLGGKFY